MLALWSQKDAEHLEQVTAYENFVSEYRLTGFVIHFFHNLQLLDLK